MRTPLLLLTSLVIVPAHLWGQAPVRDTASSDSALFARFPAPAPYLGRPARLDLDSDPNARHFRTRLSGALEHGANFAGRFAIVTWGCGTQCQSYAILEVPTGRVIADSSLDFSCSDVSYRLESTLVIERGDTATYGPCSPATARLWHWTGLHFERVSPPQ